MKILVADDDAISRSILGRALERMGYETVFAENGREAWDIFRKDEIRFVISDWEMPELSGLELCRKLRAAGGAWYCYIIMITVKTEFDSLKQAFEAGADDYISKPFNVEELSMRVKTGERIVNLETEHSNLAKKLLESRNKLEAVFDSMIEEIVVLDDRFIISSANKMFIDNVRLSFREVVGASAREIESPLLCEEAFKGLDSVFTHGRSVNFLLRIRGEEGKTLVKDIQCLPVGRGPGKITKAVLASRDVTEERKKAESIKVLNDELNFTMAQLQFKNDRLEEALEQIKGSQAQLLQSEKMASIGQLAAGVAHEINNPTGFVSSNLKTLGDYTGSLMGLVGGYQRLLKTLQAHGNDADGGLEALSVQMEDILETEKRIDIEYLRQDIPELIEESREGMERIKKIVIDLKDFAHPEDEQKYANINECIDSTLNIVWNEIKYKAVLEKDYEEIPMVLCYPRQLNQVFMNLLVNASQAIDGQGRIDVQTRHVDDAVRIIVKDTGQGIPVENLPKIFDPFFTTKPVGKGTGLGLNLVYNIVRKHGGTIQVDSQVGTGTTFTIDLPVDAGQADRTETPFDGKKEEPA